MKYTILLLAFILSFTTNAQTSFEEGKTHFENERWEAAAVQFEKVPVSEKNYLKAQEYLGDVASHQEKWEEALESLEDEDYEKAEKYYKNALKVGGSVTCYEKLINLYTEKTQESRKAENLLKEARKAHPENDWTVL